MSEQILGLVPTVAAGVIGVAAGWGARSLGWRRRLRRKQRFFGLPDGSECLLVVDQEPAGRGTAVSRHDAFALLELAGLVKECGAHAEILAHDAARQGFGARTEFCVGSPATNRRTGAHLRSLLPGVTVHSGRNSDPDDGALVIAGQTYRAAKGSAEHVLLARVTGPEGGRPVFLASGQLGITHQAAVRYLARNHARLARKYGVDGTFCLLLKVVNSAAYGPDVVELVADVTSAATTPPAPAKEPAGS